MCLSCGCGEPNERHGDDRHITQDDIAAAAEAAEMTSQQVAQNIVDGLGQGADSSAS